MDGKRCHEKRIRLDEAKVLKLGRGNGEPTTRMIGDEGKPGESSASA